MRNDMLSEVKLENLWDLVVKNIRILKKSMPSEARENKLGKIR